MAISFRCPQCNYSAQAPDTMAGKPGKCPKCRAVIQLGPPDPVAPPVFEEMPVEKNPTRKERRKTNDAAKQKKRIEAEALKLQHEASEQQRAELHRQDQLARSEIEVLTAIEEQLAEANANLVKQDIMLTNLADNVGCIYGLLVICVILSAIAGLIASN